MKKYIDKFLQYLFNAMFRKIFVKEYNELIKVHTKLEMKFKADLRDILNRDVSTAIQKHLDKQSLAIACDMDRQGYSKIIVIGNFEGKHYVRVNDIHIKSYQELARLVEQIKNMHRGYDRVFVDNGEEGLDRLRGLGLKIY